MSGIKKFLVVVALVGAVSAMGVFLFQGKNRDGQQSKPPMPTDGSGVPDGKNFLNFKRPPFGWIQPLNSDGAVAPFDLFTSPTIDVENGRVVVKTYDTLTVDDVLPLYLVAIKNKSYRIGVEGYTEATGGNPATVFLVDREANARAECQIGHRNSLIGVYVIDFRLEEQEKNGVLRAVPKVRVYDEKLSREFTLTNEDVLLDDDHIVILGDINGNQYQLPKVGATISIGKVTCTLRAFSKKDGMAKISLVDAEGHEFDRTVHLIR
jgi:hypothetical protein